MYHLIPIIFYKRISGFDNLTLITNIQYQIPNNPLPPIQDLIKEIWLGKYFPTIMCTLFFFVLDGIILA